MWTLFSWFYQKPAVPDINFFEKSINNLKKVTCSVLIRSYSSWVSGNKHIFKVRATVNP